MRLLAAGVSIIVLFALGAWGIALAMPESPEWVKIALAMVWLFSLCYLGLVFGNKRNYESRRKQGRLLVAGLIAAALVAAFLVPIRAHNIDFPKWAAEIAIVAIAVAVFMTFNHLPVHRTRAEVIALLEQALESGGDTSWDDFVSVRIAEPELEAVRLKCLEVNLESERVFSETLQSLIDELRSVQDSTQ